MTHSALPEKPTIIKKEQIRYSQPISLATAGEGDEEIHDECFTVHLKREGPQVNAMEIRCRCGATLTLDLIYAEDRR